jgi:hypothetical protein
MISFKTHDSYYRFTDNNHLKSLEFAKSLEPKRTNDKMVFHLYWRVPRNFERKQLLPIKSIIANHEKLNSGNYELNLWSNIDLSDNELLKPYNKFITHRIWNPIEELKHTPLEPFTNYFKSIILDDEKCYLGGDFFRLLCLYKYGGFYIDMDVCVLRDMSPLNQYQFLYQWGSSGTIPSEPEMFYNGAVMRLDKESVTAFKFIDLLTKIRPIPNTTMWGSKLYDHVKDESLNHFPCAWFNTEWGLFPLKPMSNAENIDLYDGAFTWHWHNCWDTPIEDGSKFAILEQLIDSKLKGIL